MNIFQVPTEISTLSEGLHALRACEWALARMLPEVITQIAAFFKN